jgi:hypothetical protein
MKRSLVVFLPSVLLLGLLPDSKAKSRDTRLLVWPLHDRKGATQILRQKQGTLL